MADPSALGAGASSEGAGRGGGVGRGRGARTRGAGGRGAGGGRGRGRGRGAVPTKHANAWAIRPARDSREVKPHADMVGWSPVHISKPTLEYEDVVRKVHVDSAAQQYTAAVVEKMRIALNGDCSPLKIFEHLASEGIEVMLKYIRSGMEIANRKARAAGGGTVLYVLPELWEMYSFLATQYYVGVLGMSVGW
jgi:hypothetical protein